MLPLGTKMPAFQLPDVVTGNTISSKQLEGKSGVLVMFICAHCPYVIHLQTELARLGRDYASSNIAMVAISANDAVNYPDDAPEKLKAMALELGFEFPFCYDESQQTARAFTAACTPDFFLFDRDLKLVYRGQLDDSRPRRGDHGNDLPVTGKDLRAAMDAVIAGKRPDTNQRTSIGCNIKWKAA